MQCDIIILFYCNIMQLYNVLKFSGVIKDLLGAYDLIFYIASGMSIYVSISTAFAAVSLRRRKQRERAFGRKDYQEIEYKSFKQ